MSELIVALEKTDGEHRQALDWFLRNTGRAIPWVRIEAQGAIGFRLATRVKGIYKPHYTQYALSVRQTLDGPYADKRVEGDGTEAGSILISRRILTRLSATKRPPTGAF